MSHKMMENRLKRLEGQVASLREQITSNASCEVLIPQFLAVKGAFNAAFEVYIKDALSECTTKDDARREQLISMLIKR